MIAYFDTSALLPLLVEEPGSSAAVRLWDTADRVAAVRLIYPEARAALAQAHRLGRVAAAQLRRLVGHLDGLMLQLHVVELTEQLSRRAGNLAEQEGLRGYDAVHLAAAEALLHPDIVFVTGDRQLGEAARRLAIHTALL